MASERARQLRANQTDAERALWQHLRNLKLQGFHFRRQAPIGNYIVDFVCHSACLIVEVDGGQHGTDEGRQSDADRSEWLIAQGYDVLRFWNNEVLANPEGVRWSILNRLGLEE